MAARDRLFVRLGATSRWITTNVPAAQVGAVKDELAQNRNGGFLVPRTAARAWDLRCH